MGFAGRLRLFAPNIKGCLDLPCFEEYGNCFSNYS